MDASTTRRSNRGLVLAALLAGPPVSRQELIRRTGLSQATVFRIVDALREERICVDVATIAKSGRGRNAASVGVNPLLTRVCGVDLGGTNCRILVADPLGVPLAVRTRATPTDHDARRLGGWLADQIAATLADAGTEPVPLSAVAVGLPGVVGAGHTVLTSENLPQIIGTEFTDTLAERLGEPDTDVVFGNDSNLALLGEMRYGAAYGLRTAVMLTLGTGIGAGVAVDGRLVTGRTGVVGEFGRLPLPESGTRLLRLLSGAGLVAEARGRGIAVDTPEQVFGADDPACVGLVEEVHRAAQHLAGIVALAYEPELILLAGRFAEVFTPNILDTMNHALATGVSVPTTIRRSELADLVGTAGALAAALTQAYVRLGVPADAAAVLPDDPTVRAETRTRLRAMS